jgi:hypothetical protein
MCLVGKKGLQLKDAADHTPEVSTLVGFLPFPEADDAVLMIEPCLPSESSF